MDNKDVPYVVHESGMARMERSNRRLWIAILLLIVLLVGSNIAWTVYESQFETITTEQDVIQDARNGENHFIGGNINGVPENTD